MRRPRPETREVHPDAPPFDRTIFDTVREPLLILDRAGKIAAANRAARSQFHCQAFEDASMGDLFRTTTGDLLEELSGQIADTGRAEFEAVSTRCDGTPFDAVVFGTPIAHRGRPAILLSIQDLTERQRADEHQARLSHKVLVAQEEERSRVSRDLHDGLGQIIAAAHFEMGMLRKRLSAEPGIEEAEFAATSALIERAGEKLRRICRGLRPPMLDDLGLIPALRQLADEVESFSDLKIDIEVRYDEDRYEESPEAGLCVFRILQESLTNVVRHADADHVHVTLVREYHWLTLSVYDNGVGFDPEELDRRRCCGVEGMKDRASLVNGTLEVQSVPGQGTRVVLRVPVPRPHQEDPP